jgi:FeS assembly SUF system regulator
MDPGLRRDDDKDLVEKMLKISRLADYAVVIMTGLSRQGAAHLSACDIAKEVGLPEPTVSKILKLLARAGLLESLRGARGGYGLVKTARDTTMADIIAAVDGPIALTACTEKGSGDCTLRGHCAMHGRWNPLNRAILTALEGVTLADMMTARPALKPRRGGKAEGARV